MTFIVTRNYRSDERLKGPWMVRNENHTFAQAQPCLWVFATEVTFVEVDEEMGYGSFIVARCQNVIMNIDSRPEQPKTWRSWFWGLLGLKLKESPLIPVHLKDERTMIDVEYTLTTPKEVKEAHARYLSAVRGFYDSQGRKISKCRELFLQADGGIFVVL